MIPKTIHYCWFGGKPLPASFLALLDGWKKMLPDYKIVQWDESNFDIGLNPYVREAYRMGSYAHVSDVCRLKALYDHGGIYLDTDVEVVRSFDPYLSLHSFVSREYGFIGTGVIGAEAGAEWIGEWLRHYDTRHFVNRWGHPVRTPNTTVLTLTLLPSLDPALYPVILPMEVFCGVEAPDGTMTAGTDTVAVHHFNSSWKRGRRTLATRIRTIALGLRVRYL
ncbi:glycosyltransferase family 32 protein [Duncaniella muris]|uniref:glycosyltransferase family 32 protein n=1 Tax=Duncaniella muris TaxID=2094150 RepID=UPI00272C5E9B|nr:glycosyltransferase [Duncaniella muris]